MHVCRISALSLPWKLMISVCLLRDSFSLRQAAGIKRFGGIPVLLLICITVHRPTSREKNRSTCYMPLKKPSEPSDGKSDSAKLLIFKGFGRYPSATEMVVQPQWRMNVQGRVESQCKPLWQNRLLEFGHKSSNLQANPNPS
jgi:hypothetical protein